MMKKFGISYKELEEDFEADASDFYAPTEVATIILPYLYQYGYITIKGYDFKYHAYLLGIPNQEVRIFITSYFAKISA